MSRKKFNYENLKEGGDGMFFFHKKTKHPAKQLSHTDKTWTNIRYTHHPNRQKDYEIDLEDFDEIDQVYKTKKNFTDSIYTRGRVINIKNKKR